MKRIPLCTVLAVALLVVALPAWAVDPNVGLGEPQGFSAEGRVVIRRPQYVVSYDSRRGGADWAAWRLTLGDLGQAPRYRGGFASEPMLPAGWFRATDAGYRGTGFDRGHLVPSADRTSSVADNQATFFLSNVLPQRPELNRGAWEGLEAEVRRRARSGRDLYVVAGPQWPASGGDRAGGVAVPVAFWKVAVDLPHGGEAADVVASTEVLAAVMPNSEATRGRRWTAYRTTLRSAERACSCLLLAAVAAPVKAQLVDRK